MKAGDVLQALSIAFEAIVPLFLIIAVGYGVKRLGWIGLEEVRRFNKVTFYTFMPVMLFYNIYISDFSQAARQRGRNDDRALPRQAGRCLS